MREPFILYRRPDGAREGKTFYVGFWDQEKIKYVGRRSVAALVAELRGALPPGTSPFTKAGARRIVEAWLEDHTPAPVRGQTLTLSAYLLGFWADKGQYAESARARGHKISSEYLANNRSNISNHVVPWLSATSPGLALRAVTAGHLEALIMYLREHGTGKRGTRWGTQADTGKPLTSRTINAVRQSVAVALAEATRLGLMRDNPADRAPKLAEIKTARGVLTVAEARAVLAAPWADPRAHAASLLAATTGMRLGEVRGLKLDAIGDGEIEVRLSWSDTDGGKDPKWRSIRTVPVPSHVEKVLRAVAAQNPWGDGFVIYGAHRGHPRGKRDIRTGLSAALAYAGISSERGVTFHSWRHFYNSQMRDRIPDHALRQLTGHRSEQMTERYTHITEESRAAAAAIAGQIIVEATRI